MKKILFLALLGCNFANAQFKVGVYGSPNITKSYGRSFEIRDISGSKVDSEIKFGQGYNLGASLVYDISKHVDVSLNIEHSKKEYLQNVFSTSYSFNYQQNEVKWSFSQLTPSVTVRYKHKFFYISTGIGYGITSKDYLNSQDTFNLKASFGHQFNITEKSKINLFVSDEYMTRSYNKLWGSSSINTIGLGIGFETSL